MEIEKLKYIFNQFKHKGEFDSFKALTSGHINATYLIKTKKKPYFILQQINNDVFSDVPGLVANKVAISQHLMVKLKTLPINELEQRVLTFVKTKKDTSYYHQDENGSYWNLMVYIEESINYENVTNEDVAYEAGKLFGDFLNLTNDFDASKLTVVIPKFHDMSFRYSQFEHALKNAPNDRLNNAKRYIKLVEDFKPEMHVIEKLKNSGAIKIRVTHNDTKISNALFDINNKGLCVIDTDTIMPGIVHYDFGDAIRTICNTAVEDETNLDLVNFNFTYYKAYVKGFLEKMKNSLSPIEIKYLPLGAKTMIFIMALRFLTDYLKGDIYYRTSYPEHNFDRAKNQFKLIESFNESMKELDTDKYSTLIH